jgi:hypothetical protein
MILNAMQPARLAQAWDACANQCSYGSDVSDASVTRERLHNCTTKSTMLDGEAF